MIRSGGLENCIKLPEEIGIMPAEEDNMRVPHEELEGRGMIFLNGFWYGPNLEPIEGVFQFG